MGDEQRLSPDDQIRLAREQFDSGRDFTVSVEEEFALLDPETLELANRFEELREGVRGTPLEEHLVGELIASEVEVKTGLCTSFGEAAARMGERRVQLGALADELGIALASTGTHPWSPAGRTSGSSTRRTTAGTTSSCSTSSGATTPSGSTCTSASAAPTARSPSTTRCAASCPSCSRSPRARPLVEDCVSGLHSARTQIFTRMFPRCGIPDPYPGWLGYERYVRFLYETRSITEHTQIWWSVRPHLAFPTVEIRICDAQPDLGDAQSLAALCYALTARIARAVDEEEPLPDLAPRLVEENLWRAIRYGMSDELIDFDRGEPVPARARLEALLEWVAPVAGEIGAAPYLALPEANSAERQYARLAEGLTLRDVFAELVRPREVVRG